jgi:hypothetical protein
MEMGKKNGILKQKHWNKDKFEQRQNWTRKLTNFLIQKSQGQNVEIQ